MLRFLKWSLFSCGLLASVLAFSAWAADNDKKESAAKKSGDKPAAETKADEKPVDLNKVPDGTNAELMDYIKKVAGTRPQSMEDLMKMSKAISAASDKILDANPSEQELKKILLLRMQLPMSPAETTAYGEKLTKVAAELTKAGKAEMAREVTSMSYLVKLKSAEDAEAFQKAIVEAVEYLGDGKLQKADLMLVLNIAGAAEQIEDQKVAAATLEKVISLLKDSEIDELKDKMDELVKQLEGTLRRLKLVGNKIELEGNLLSGDKLDLAQYKGKVVLVDFWATWCRPCLEEIPNMKKNYEAYHAKGFDIIGLSGDENRETVEKFVKDKEIPWAIVYGDNAPSPSFDYYGIAGIPVMILVGKDGKVISTTAIGEELDKLLEQQLGPAEKKGEKKPEKKGELKLQLKKAD